jgi:hypothetical protein
MVVPEEVLRGLEKAFAYGFYPTVTLNGKEQKIPCRVSDVRIDTGRLQCVVSLGMEGKATLGYFPGDCAEEGELVRLTGNGATEATSVELELDVTESQAARFGHLEEQIVRYSPLPSVLNQELLRLLYYQ